MIYGSVLNWVLVILFINAFGFFCMWEDKRRAKKHLYRISEQNLWTLAILGGAPGMTMAMSIFRHKTKHINFKIGFPVLMIIQLCLYAYGLFLFF